MFNFWKFSRRGQHGRRQPSHAHSELGETPDYQNFFGLRIIWLRNTAIQQFGGGERVLVEGLRCLCEMGARATLVLPEPLSSKFVAFFYDCGSDIMVLPRFTCTEWGYPGRFGRVIRFFKRVRALRRAIASVAPNLIIANEHHEARSLWYYSLGGLLPLPPVITFIHGSPFQFPLDTTKYALVFRRNFLDIWAADPIYREMIPVDPPAMKLLQRIRFEIDCLALRAGVRMCRQVLVLSHKNRKEVERLYGVRNVEVLCPGGYTDKELSVANHRRMPAAAREANHPIVLSVCRLIDKKRVDLVIRAFRTFRDRNPQSAANLFIGGTGPEEAALRELAHALGLGDYVHFLGFIPDSELCDWYGACDLFLSADNADYDLTVMRALMEGKKIVVSTQYEIPVRLTSLRRHFFTASANPDSFAEVISQALASPTTPRNGTDLHELRSMTWENYFNSVLDRSQRIISNFN